MESYSRIIVYSAGAYSIFLAVFHIMFWRIPLFNWREELNKLSPVNRGVIQVLNICIIEIFIFAGYASFFHCDEILSTQTGRIFLAGFSIFWFVRFICQFLFWENNNFIFHALFAAGFILYMLPLLI